MNFLPAIEIALMNIPSSFIKRSDDSIEIRQGGGCLSIVGLPFLCAGLFALLTVVGVVPAGNADEYSLIAWSILFQCRRLKRRECCGYVVLSMRTIPRLITCIYFCIFRNLFRQSYNFCF
jgi:hypothetical protein